MMRYKEHRNGTGKKKGKSDGVSVFYKLLILTEKLIMLWKFYASIGRNITERVRTISHLRHRQKKSALLSDIE